VAASAARASRAVLTVTEYGQAILPTPSWLEGLLPRIVGLAAVHLCRRHEP
jgi:hypothetical protein